MKRAIIFLLLLWAVPGWAEVYQFHVAGATHKPEGDIVSVRLDKTATSGGRMSRKLYLFVRVDMGPEMKTNNEGRKMMIEHYANGTLVRPEPGLAPEVLADNRFRIIFGKLDLAAKAKGVTIAWKRVRDRKDDYQPLLGVVFDYYDLITDKFKGTTLKTSMEIKEISDAGKTIQQIPR